MIIDTHCHYNLPPLVNQPKYWVEAQAAGVTHSLIVGTTIESSALAVDLASTHPHLAAAVGIHPQEYQKLAVTAATTNTYDLTHLTAHIAQDMVQLEQLASKQKVLAIGETGLDYSRLPEDENQQRYSKELQQLALIAHIQLAHRYHLPLIFHVRDQGETAYHDLIKILTTHHQGHEPFILHCVSGSLSYLKAALELGAYVSVAGNVTYKNAHSIRELVTHTPHDRLLLETDAPFLPPHPFRGQVCEPAMIAHTAEFLKTELHRDLETIYNTTRQFFPAFT